MARRKNFRLITLALIALLPGVLKRPLYRTCFGYRIGKRVRLGFTLIDADTCEIDDDVSIRHLNVFIGVKNLVIGNHVRIGYLNIVRGGDDVRIGRYAEIMRLNEINSIPDPIVMNPVDPTFVLGEGSVITTGHKIDFTDRVEIGKRTIIGGRNSSFWTHNRQRTKQILIGSFSYVGSEIRVAPGGVIPSHCIVGIGSVVTGELTEENHLIAGVPARLIKPLSEQDRFLIEYKTRPDLPDNL
jgi:acetyltransferase-like isoleucine patch superfamily enzyme